MSISRPAVKAIMPRESIWYGAGHTAVAGIYPTRQMIIINAEYTPAQYMERPYASVPDIDIESAYWHGNTILTIPKEKKVDPVTVSPKMLSLLCRANAL